MSAATRRQYDRQALVYDWLWKGYVRRTHDALAAHTTIAPGEHVLDVGCGTGVFLQRLADRHPGQPLTGVDLSPGMLRVARRRLAAHPHVTLVEAAADTLPFADARFDMVVSASTLHYWPDPVAALREAARVLRPGGRLALLDWSRDFWWMRALDAGLRAVDAAHGRTLSAAELRAALAGAGYARVAVTPMRIGMWGLMVATAHVPHR